MTAATATRQQQQQQHNSHRSNNGAKSWPRPSHAGLSGCQWRFRDSFIHSCALDDEDDGDVAGCVAVGGVYRTPWEMWQNRIRKVHGVSLVPIGVSN